MDVKGKGRGIFEILSLNLHGRLKRNHVNPSRDTLVAGLDLPNTKWFFQLYLYAQHINIETNEIWRSIILLSGAQLFILLNLSTRSSSVA
jgi:hypothetical protein